MKRSVAFCLASLALATAAGASTPLYAESSYPAQSAQNAGSDVISQIRKVKGLRFVSTSAPSDEACRIYLNIPCYSPQEVQNAYGLTPLLSAGYTGVGQTIIIIGSFGSPTIAQDLKTFDAAFGLPDPPSFTVLAPLGTASFDPNDPGQVGWAFETTLDVEWAHAIAPGANIVLLTSPVDETEGVEGMPEFLQLEEYALYHGLGQVISQSWGATENTLFTPAGREVLNGFTNFYLRAASEGITVLASAGDTGSANAEIDGTTFYPTPTVIFPASSPLVTAVGGTSLYADTSGNYQAETVWNDPGVGATGGGASQYFAEPLYQRFLTNADQTLLNGRRGIPDIAYNADPNTAILIYVGFFPQGSALNAYYTIGGTSEGSPQWAGIIADANQLAGHSLGFVNPTLYALGARGAQTEFFHDITMGNNSFAGVPGYNATPGWDPTTGWGTPNLGALVIELAKH
jgi:subtilase family serine protease